MRNLRLHLKMLVLLLLVSSCNRVDTESDKQVYYEIKINIANHNFYSNQATYQYKFNNLSVYLFKNGILHKVYNNIILNEDRICKIDDDMPQTSSKLYFLANSEHSVDMPSLIVGATTEDEFFAMETKASSSPDIANPILMGEMNIHSTDNLDYNVTLDNCISRIDVTTMAPNIIIEGIEINGVADRSFVYKQSPVSSPTGAAKIDVKKSYKPGITSKQGVIYVYEQQGGQTVSINARIGGIKNVLTTKLPSVLSRNYSYNIKISGAGASADVEVVTPPWEDGENSDTTPNLTNDVKIDVDNSILSRGVSVSETLDTLFLPYYNSSSKLVLKADSQLEVFVSGTDINISPYISRAKADYVTNMFDISFEHTTATNPATRYAYLHIKDKKNPGYFSNVIVIEIDRSRTVFTGVMADNFEGLNCSFDSYIDGDIGTLTVLDGASVSFQGDTQWLRSELMEGKRTKYTIKAGYRPNDPTADGRDQSTTIVVTHGTGASSVEERYEITRKNFGLPVELINDTYWCKFNLRGNAISFADQVQINDPISQETDLYTYLKTCSAEQFMVAMGDVYKGRNHTGLKLKADPTFASGFSFENYASTNSNGNIINSDPTKQCPAGYEIPNYTDFSNVLGTKEINFPATSNNEASTINEGREFYIYKRTNVEFDGAMITEMIVNKVESENNPNFTIMGLGHQWDKGGMKFDDTILATITTSASWMCGQRFSSRAHNEHKTITIRCVKTAGAFIF